MMMMFFSLFLFSSKWATFFSYFLFFHCYLIPIWGFSQLQFFFCTKKKMMPFYMECKKKIPKTNKSGYYYYECPRKKRWFPILMMMMFCRVFFVLFIVEIDRSIYKYLSGFQNIFLGLIWMTKTKKMTMMKMKKISFHHDEHTHIIQ